MTFGAGRRFTLRSAELRERGENALEPLPSPEEVAALDDAARHPLLEELRVELYAIASVIADETVQRALRERPAYPPYGLVRSMHSESRLLVANPEAVKEGAIVDFRALGKAYLDTMVFHLHRQFTDQRGSPERWRLRRLDDLLRLLRIPAGPASRARMRDGLSFMYGGMHFGVSVCAQLAEVMARMLQGFDVSPSETTAIMARSMRVAYRLAALNLDHVIPAYQNLLVPPSAPSRETAGWMDAGKFLIQFSGEAPWRIDVRDGALHGPGGRPLEAMATTYSTQGCPARSSSSGNPSAIAALWRWCIELAHVNGLLGSPVDGDTPVANTTD